MTRYSAINPGYRTFLSPQTSPRLGRADRRAARSESLVASAALRQIPDPRRAGLLGARSRSLVAPVGRRSLAAAGTAAECTHRCEPPSNHERGGRRTRGAGERQSFHTKADTNELAAQAAPRRAWLILLAAAVMLGVQIVVVAHKAWE